mgnify:CR=1 FL=1
MSCGQRVRLSAVHRSPRRSRLHHTAARHRHAHAADFRLSGAPLPFLSVQHDVRPVGLSDDLVHLIVCKLRAGASVSAAARAAGVSRQRVYRAAERHDELRALLPTNAGTAAPQQPRPSVDDDQPGDRPRYDEDLTREQTTELCRSLGRLRNLRDAALDAGVDLFPNRIRPRDLPREARNLLRDALEIVQAARLPKPPGAEQQALQQWLAGAEWPHDVELDVKALRALSARAADNFEAVQRARAKLKARHERRSKRDAAGDDWVAF